MIRASSLPSQWPIKTLGEVAVFLDHLRKPIKASDRVEGQYAYYGANGYQGSIDDYIFDEPLLLIAEDGGHFGSPDKDIAYIATGKYWVNNHAHVCKPLDGITLEYLYRVLKRYDVRPFVKGATRLKLTKGEALQIPIPVPPINEQKRIATILDKADEIRRKRQQTIELADQFLRSVFLDMFGDPIVNSKGWEFHPLGEIAEIQIGPFGTQLHKEDYTSDEVPVINPIHIQDGKIFPNWELTITPEKSEELKQYQLHLHDVVLSRRGEMGRCALVTEKEIGWVCGTGGLIIRHQRGERFAVYLQRLLSSHQIKRSLESKSQGATLSNLNQTIIGGLSIPVPVEISLSNYHKIERQIDGMLLNQKQSQEQLHQLNKSLQSEFFVR